ncbi:ricin-type beta-trefoil lectin domain protein [Cellulosimicrobium composti]|nr:ricin-type beta-trefoil lectin domain protein [Cellulosimicrobium composti]
MHHGTMHHRLTALASGIGVVVASVGLATAASASAPAGTPTSAGSAVPALLAGPVPSPDDLSPGQLHALERDLGLDAAGVADRLALDAATGAVEQALSGGLGAAYAGTWVDADAATPVVAVTDPAAVPEVEAAGAEAVVVERGLAELDAVATGLDQVSTPDAVQAWYVDVTTNEVVVESLDPAAAEAFVAASGVDPAAVRTEVVDAPYELTADVRGGDRYITRDPGASSGSACSIGFAVQGGFVTAGHCGAAGKEVLTAGWARMGTVQAASFPGHDYAWVRVDAGFSPVPRVNNYAGGTVDVAGSAEAPVGASVCRSGATTGWRCGVIEQKNITVNYGNGDIPGLVRGSACAEGGDSGGSVISGNQAQGVTSGRINDCSNGGKFIYQPVNPILSAYGLSLVTTGGGSGSALVGLAGKCIDVPGSDFSDGKRLQLWTCNGTNAQRWTFESDGTVRAGGKCMDVAWAATADGTAVQLANCSGHPAQQFVLSGAGDLVSVLANKCVDVPSSNSTDGTKLQIWTCNGTAAQKWHRA